MQAHESAFSSFERALELLEKSVGTHHPRLGYALVGLARLSLEQGDAEQAVGFARRALAVRETGDAPPAELGKAQFVLAQALWVRGEDSGEARMLAELARATYEAAGLEEEASSVTKWLPTRDESQ